jgi:signal transduction histidine kinase
MGLDEWCVEPRGVELLRNAGQRFYASDVTLPPPLTLSNIMRWQGLGAIDVHIESFDEPRRDEAIAYEFTDIGKRLFEYVDEPVQSAFDALARTQSELARNEALQNRDIDVEMSAALRHARLIAHEVRNALLPMQHFLDRVWEIVEHAGLGGSVSVSRDKIEASISRIHRFVDTSVRMSSPIEDIPVPFAILEAIDEARRMLNGGFAGSLRTETLPGTANPQCRGHRGRFGLMLSNVLRNAVQSGGSNVEITVTVDARNPENVHLIIADDGPGVPEHLGDRIFAPGVTTKPDGTGHGLTLVRQVIERDFGGTVTLEPGPRGARFHFHIPTVQENP